jgi:hypothetical protein
MMLHALARGIGAVFAILGVILTIAGIIGIVTKIL